MFCKRPNNNLIQCDETLNNRSLLVKDNKSMIYKNGFVVPNNNDFVKILKILLL